MSIHFGTAEAIIPHPILVILLVAAFLLLFFGPYLEDILRSLYKAPK